jgi:hypothetical protein
MLNTHTHTHTFHAMCFMNLIVSAFYVDECMNFKLYEFNVY